RVVRKIDPGAKEEYMPDPKVVGDIKNILGPLWQNQREQVTLYRGTPTPDNNNSGYLGRIGIYEVLPVTEKIGRLILERAPASAIERQAREEGMIALKQDGYLKVVEGVTTIEEILRVAEE
ncbi:type II secretion system protein GspE, partial [Candidatus Woesebacteria bacterium]|nr:type II secretion system protein GspE [Candidatus Woesebacteria bacterium]